MSNEENQQQKPAGAHEHGQDTVTINMTVDDGAGKDFSIHRGRQTVERIKEVCGVSPTYVIAQIGTDGTLTALADDGAVVLKGGERFIAHVRGGGAS